MPHTAKQTQTGPSPALMISAAATFVLAKGLLVSGTIAGHMPLLAWGLFAGFIAGGLGCLAAIRAMIECVVARSIERTAVQVGQAIAEGLAADQQHQREKGSVDRIYS